MNFSKDYHHLAAKHTLSKQQCGKHYTQIHSSQTHISPLLCHANIHTKQPLHLVEVNSLVQSLLAVSCQVNKHLPFPVDFIDPLLDLLSTEIASLNEVLASLDHRLQVRMPCLHLIFHGLKHQEHSPFSFCFSWQSNDLIEWTNSDLQFFACLLAFSLTFLKTESSVT